MVVPETIYKCVTYQGHGSGTLKVYENQLSFHTKETGGYSEKIYTLPWYKIQKRRVSKSDREVSPQLIFVLMSGTEAIFKVEDRVTLEVLRDDIAERLKRYRAKYPQWEQFQHDKDVTAAAVNTTANTTAKKQSTPYRMAAATSNNNTNKSTPYRMAAVSTTTTQPIANDVPETIYKAVTYQGHGSGTLKLYDNQLNFHTKETGSYDTTEKIFTLPWKKIRRRKVSKSDSDVGMLHPQLIFVLMSGTEAIFQVEDRVTLEVLRDDIHERLTRYRKKHPNWDI